MSNQIARNAIASYLPHNQSDVMTLINPAVITTSNINKNATKFSHCNGVIGTVVGTATVFPGKKIGTLDYYDFIQDTTIESGCFQIKIKQSGLYQLNATFVCAGIAGVNTQNYSLGLQLKKAGVNDPNWIGGECITMEPAGGGFALMSNGVYYLEAGWIARFEIGSSQAGDQFKESSAGGQNCRTQLFITKLL